MLFHLTIFYLQTIHRLNLPSVHLTNAITMLYPALLPCSIQRYYHALCLSYH